MSDQFPRIQLVTLTELIEPSLFAQLIGVSDDTVRGWIEQGTLPVVKVGRRRLINRQKIANALTEGKTVFQRGDFID